MPRKWPFYAPAEIHSKPITTFSGRMIRLSLKLPSAVVVTSEDILKLYGHQRINGNPFGFLQGPAYECCAV